MQAELVKAPVANTSIGQASMHDSAEFAELVQEARKAAVTPKSEADRAELMRSSVEQMQSLHRPAQEDAVGRAEAAAPEARQVAVATLEDCNTYVQNARRLAGEAQAAYERPPQPIVTELKFEIGQLQSQFRDLNQEIGQKVNQFVDLVSDVKIDTCNRLYDLDGKLPRHSATGSSPKRRSEYGWP